MSQKVDPQHHTMRAEMAQPKTLVSGRYVIRRLVAEGAQKSVYLADDTALERPCVVALLRNDSLDGEDRVRARREAQSMARLGAQPNIVTVYDIGEDDGRLFIVSEYVGGGDLRRALRAANGALPLDRALAIVGDLAHALGAAHARGVVHRDVKPANVLLTPEGTAKLGDFGVAAALDRARITLSGSVLGTAGYMAPEQALGGDIDARSDLYSLGAVFYELITGRPPFLGDDALAVISQHINVAPVAPSWHNRAVGQGVEDLVLRLLMKSPDARPASALDVAREVQALASAPSDTAPAPEGTAALRGLAWGRFVGRHEELAQLKTALDRAQSAEGSATMITGEPGIGKTRLSEEFAVYARLRGARLLRGRCYEGEGSLPYQPFIEAFREYVRERSDPPLREELGTGVTEIAALVSEVRRRFPEVPDTLATAPSDLQRGRLFDSVTQFLANAAKASPLVLVLEDLHWGDSASLLLLRHLVPRIARERVLIVGTYRDVELDAKHPLADAVGVLRREQNYQRILLRGLTVDTVEELLASMSESEDDRADRRELAEALYRETEGNPFFIREIVSHLIEEHKLYREGDRWTSNSPSLTDLGIPEGIRDVIGRRVARLSEGCHRMLTVASAMEAGFAWEVMTAVNEEDEGALLDHLDEALAAQLVAERKDQAGIFDFTHALIRQTLYEELSAPRRMLLHRRIAGALEELHTAALDAHAGEIAYHYYRAAPSGTATEKAIAFGRRAASRAMAHYAHEEALLHLERSMEMLELAEAPAPRLRATLLIETAGALKRAAAMQDARVRYIEAAEIGLAHNFADVVASAALGIEMMPSEAGVVDDYLVRLTEVALAGLDADQQPVRARLLACQARALGWGLDAPVRISLTGEAVRIARESGDRDALAHVLSEHRVMLAGPAHTEERLSIAEEVSQIARQLGNAELELNGECWRVAELVELGELGELPVAVEELTQKTARLKQPVFLWYRAVFDAMRALLEGRFGDAEQRMPQVLTLGQPVNSSLALQVYSAQMLALRWLQGRLAEIEPVFRALAMQYPELPALQAPTAFMLSELGRDEEARAILLKLAGDSGFGGIPADSTWLMNMSLLAQVCAHLGDREHAVLLYDRMAPFAARNVVLGEALVSNGSCSRYLAKLAATIERWDDAEGHFDLARKANTKMGARPFVALGAYDHAVALIARGTADRDRARALLREARVTGDGLGMTRLVEMCDELVGNAT